MTGLELKAWRQRLRLKKSEAAAKLGVSGDTYARWEGRSAVPSYVGLACAAIAQGIPEVRG